jgi:ATP-dependent DNA ligase
MKEKGALPPFVNIVETIKCQGNKTLFKRLFEIGADHLKKYFSEIIAKGGEGVMLREPQSLYKAGRSSSLMKYKPFFDTEVKVIENKYPHGFECQQ